MLYVGENPWPESSSLSPRETFHIEVLGSDEEPEDERVHARIMVRTGSIEGARERALSLFRRARVPQRSGSPAEAVRIIDGAGAEVFRWSRFDEPH
jgi:hypothetical protein